MFVRSIVAVDSDILSGKKKQRVREGEGGPSERNQDQVCGTKSFHIFGPGLLTLSQYALPDWVDMGSHSAFETYDTNGMIPYLHNGCIEKLEILKSSWVWSICRAFLRSKNLVYCLVIDIAHVDWWYLVVSSIHNNEIICLENSLVRWVNWGRCNARK